MNTRTVYRVVRIHDGKYFNSHFVNDLYEVRCFRCEYYEEMHDSEIERDYDGYTVCPSCWNWGTLDIRLKFCDSQYDFCRTDGTKTRTKCNNLWGHLGIHEGRVDYKIGWGNEKA